MAAMNGVLYLEQAKVLRRGSVLIAREPGDKYLHYRARDAKLPMFSVLERSFFSAPKHATRT